MYSVEVAGNIGSVYTETDMLQGKAPGDGTLGYGSVATGTGVFVMCKVATSQNLIKGQLVTIDASYIATVQATGSPAPTSRVQLGVTVCTITASASSHLWVQVYGRGLVLASTSCEPNVLLGGGSVAGQVDDVTASTSAVIDGIWTTASTGAASALVACVLNYPTFIRG